MRSIIVVFILVSISACSYAAMTQKIIILQSGKTINLIDEVEWPCEASWARIDPPSLVNNRVNQYISFRDYGGPVIVHGPTTITLEYGSLPVATPDAITSTPDAIGGGE